MPSDSTLLAIYEFVKIFIVPALLVVVTIGLIALIVWSNFKSREEKWNL